MHTQLHRTGARVLRSATGIGLSALLMAALLLTGCDAAGTEPPGGNDGQPTSINGQVTNDAGYALRSAEAESRSALLAPVEGAVVTAVAVEADGSTNPLEGQAETNAEGEFTIEIENATDVVMLHAEAEENDFSSSVLVYVGDQSSVEAAPMTAESDVEAEVYVEAKGQDDEGDVTMADVAAHVTSEVAADIEAGTATAAEVAAAVHAEAHAAAAYARAQGEGSVEDAQEAKLSAYAQLQAALNGASEAEAEEDIHAFVEAVATAYTSAGFTAKTQAEARLAAKTALYQNTDADAHFALRKQAEVLAAIATTQAVEAAFEGADEAQGEVENAGAALITEIRAAPSAQAIAEAKADYEAEVEAQLETAFGVDAALLADAETSIEVAVTALDAAIAAANASAETIAEAYATFYASAETAAESALEASSDAEASATVIVLLSVS